MVRLAEVCMRGACSAQLSLTSEISNGKIVVNMKKRKRRPASALCKTIVTKEITATPEFEDSLVGQKEITVS
jgi:hypothetical protein